MSNDNDVIKSGSSFYNPSHTTALNYRGAGVAREIVQKAQSSLASSGEASAKAERLIHDVQLQPVRKPITHRDLARAEYDVATSEVKIGGEAELIARLRAESEPTEQSEALELEMKTVLWHQRGLVFELRKFLRRAA